MSAAANKPHTYLNPVYNQPFPDPFVLKYRNEYWAYCTGYGNDGGCFGILHSVDLVHWREVGSALHPPPFAVTCYWAPEVFYDNGIFYLYYSVGNEAQMEIRVATAPAPNGPFTDSGHKLTNEEFAIDPHVFVDTDGARYLFYATDFLTHTHIGTGTVVDKMRDEFTLEGNPQPVTRARYDWQVYDPQREAKGGVRWHTVEGPFVLQRKGLYYEMFSGGNWQQPTYGVSYATSRQIIGPEEWEQAADGKQILPILRTLPGKVIGPGHNSVIRGPDNRALYCVYHLWAHDLSGRIMALDRLGWAGSRLFINGATTTPQPAPNGATLTGFSEAAMRCPDSNWEYISGDWMRENNSLYQQAEAETAEARCTFESPSVLLEVSLGASTGMTGMYGLIVRGAEGLLFQFMLEPGRNCGTITRQGPEEWSTENIPLPHNFNPNAFHLLRIEVDALLVKMTFGNELIKRQTLLAAVACSLSLVTQQCRAVFSGFALTAGWENLFDDDIDLAALGWRGGPGWGVEKQELICRSIADTPSIIMKEHRCDDYEFIVNARLIDQERGGCYGFYPVATEDDLGLLVTVEQLHGRWALLVRSEAGLQSHALPETFAAEEYRQFCFRKKGRQLFISIEASEICAFEAPAIATRVGLYAQRGRAAFDMVGVTRLSN